jgi:ABC-type polysaccharide/polyol phosphate export permease
LEAPGTHPVAARLEPQSVRVVRPVKRRVGLRDVWAGRQVIGILAGRDFKAKYKQSLLGPIWLVFQPLALLIAFFIAFRNLANVQPGVPYSVFALVGLSAWAFFQASMTIGAASIISNLTLVRFTPCPRFAFPVAGVIASLPSWVVTTAAALVAAVVTGTLSPRALLLPFAIAWLFLLTLGFVALAASVSVRYRDVLSVLPFLLQIGVFLAPVGYPLAQLGTTARGVVELNPLTGLIEAWRWMIIDGYPATSRAVVYSLVITVLVVAAGWRVFTRVETTMADVI